MRPALLMAFVSGQRASVATSASRPVDDGAGLGARAAVRLADGERPALFVLGGERGVQGAVELARRIVGDVQQLGVGTGGKRDGEEGEDRQEGDDGLPNQRGRAAQEVDTGMGGPFTRDGHGQRPLRWARALGLVFGLGC
jgi:hypothetical protein